MSFHPYEEPEARYVSESIIREAFNSGQFWRRAKEREFEVWFDQDTHYTRKQASERSLQYCARSQILRYYDSENTLIAVVHQIRKRDGTLGASGLPDPKYLDLGREILILKK